MPASSPPEWSQTYDQGGWDLPPVLVSASVDVDDISDVELPLERELVLGEEDEAGSGIDVGPTGALGLPASADNIVSARGAVLRTRPS